MRRALQSLDVLAVLDVVTNDLTEIASHVLPCAAELERADALTGTMSMVPAVFAQRARAVLPVAADRRPAWRILVDLARHMDLDPLLPSDLTDDEQVLGALMGFDPDGQDIPWGEVEDPQPTYGWVADRVLPEDRWQLAPPELVQQLDETRERRSLDGSRLLLVPRRQPRHMNSALIDGGGPPGRADRPLLEVHPDDARAAGVADGTRVRVISEHGEVEATVRCDPRLRPGVVSLPHGFVATNVNDLTTSRVGVDPLTGMVTLSGIEVSLRPASVVTP